MSRSPRSRSSRRRRCRRRNRGPPTTTRREPRAATRYTFSRDVRVSPPWLHVQVQGCSSLRSVAQRSPSVLSPQPPIRSRRTGFPSSERPRGNTFSGGPLASDQRSPSSLWRYVLGSPTATQRFPPWARPQKIPETASFGIRLASRPLVAVVAMEDRSGSRGNEAPVRMHDGGPGRAGLRGLPRSSGRHRGTGPFRPRLPSSRPTATDRSPSDRTSEK